MKTIKIILSLFVMAVVSLGASYSFADSGIYAGASYSKLEYSEPYIDLDFETVGAVVGYSLNSSFGIEARYAQGQSGDDLGGVGIDIDKTASILGRLSLPNETNIKPYIVAGWTEGWMDAEGYGSMSVTSFSWGAGVGFALTDELSINTEFMSAIDKDDVEVNQLSLMAVYQF